MSIDLSDLGLLPVTSAATQDAGNALPNAPISPKHVVQTGSLLARTLFHVWRGDRLTMIESPPGAGKTTIICEVLYHLLRDSELSLAVACPTRDGAVDLAKRLVSLVGTEDSAPKVVFSVKGMAGPEGTYPHAPMGSRSVVVRTTASCKFNSPTVDVLIFDEAYQVTYSDASKAASKCEQILLVGDPGQIGPVVKVNTRPWDNMRFNPASRAPEAFVNLEGAIVLHMDATFRVGQRTVDTIAPLYGFGFTSKRPERFLVNEFGARVGEIEALKIRPISNRVDLQTMVAIANFAVSHVGKTVRSFDENGKPVDELVKPEDIAVIVPHNDQAAALGAMLRNSSATNLPRPGAGARIYVGTADRAQGGQWKVVVALDPMIGHASAGAHQLALGRLCVMLSRHTHSLTWVHDGEWEAKFNTLIEDDENASTKSVDDAHRSIAVRRIATRDASALNLADYNVNYDTELVKS